MITTLIVTYNRLEFLKQSIYSVLNQTVIPDKLLIYNNNSSDGTKEYLDSLDNNTVHVVNASINTGGAVVFIMEYWKLVLLVLTGSGLWMMIPLQNLVL